MANGLKTRVPLRCLILPLRDSHHTMELVPNATQACMTDLSSELAEILSTNERIASNRDRSKSE